MNAQNDKYNGWSNYATWRVNLEMFDGLDPSDICPTREDAEANLSGFLRDIACQNIESTTDDGFGRDYALAFMNDVDWDEIADYLIVNYSDKFTK